MRAISLSRLAQVLVLSGLAASAAVIRTTGAHSAVSIVQGSADFESVGALYDNPYSEDGMQFSRSDLSFNNNGCGFAGCPDHPGFAGLSGNYMYGVGGGYFELAAGAGRQFVGLEFQVATGWAESTADFGWEAYLGGTLVGSGTAHDIAVGSVVGFRDAGGFDVLRYHDVLSWGTPAFDSVRAQFTGAVAAVPEPASIVLLGAGLCCLSLLARRRNPGGR